MGPHVDAQRLYETLCAIIAARENVVFTKITVTKKEAAPDAANIQDGGQEKRAV